MSRPSDQQARLARHQPHRRRIAINGKFLITLSEHKSGVFRVAYELVMAMDAILARGEPRYADLECTLFTPAGTPELPLSAITLRRSGFGSTVLKGIAWEQLVLPLLARPATLVSLCNLGPAVYPNAYTMIHDAQVYSSPDSYSRAFRHWYRLMLPHLGRSNRGILAVSRFSGGELRRYGVVEGGRLEVVHNGCDHVLRIDADADYPRRVDLDGRPYVVALASTQAHKNIALLLQAFGLPQLAGVTLALFGSDGREDFERQGLEVPPNVRFLGRIADPELIGLLQGATALAFPSLTEGFGLPPLEAMRVGCPTIVARCGALPEVCGEAALLADPGNPTQWASRIRALVDDPDFADAMRARGRVHAASFTWERAARRVLDIALGERPAAAAHHGSVAPAR